MYPHHNSRIQEFTSSLSFPSLEDQESVKRSNDSGNCSGSDQKPVLPIKSLDTLSDLSTTCDITHELLKFPARAAWLELLELKSEAARALCLDYLMGGFMRYLQPDSRV